MNECRKSIPTLELLQESPIPFLQANKSPINEENNGIQSNPSGRPICLSQMSRISTSTPTLDRMTRMVSEDQSPQRRRNGISRNPSDASLISKESISSLRSQRFELVFTKYSPNKGD